MLVDFQTVQSTVTGDQGTGINATGISNVKTGIRLNFDDLLANSLGADLQQLPHLPTTKTTHSADIAAGEPGTDKIVNKPINSTTTGKQLAIELETLDKLDDNFVQTLFAAIQQNPEIRQIFLKFTNKGRGQIPLTKQSLTATISARKVAESGKRQIVKLLQINKTGHLLPGKQLSASVNPEKKSVKQNNSRAPVSAAMGTQQSKNMTTGQMNSVEEMKTWLYQQLAARGVEIEKLEIRVDSTTEHKPGPVTDNLLRWRLQSKTGAAIHKINDALQQLVDAPDSKMPEQIRNQLKSFADRVKNNLASKTSINFNFKVENSQVAEQLQEQLQPVLRKLNRQNVVFEILVTTTGEGDGGEIVTELVANQHTAKGKKGNLSSSQGRMLDPEVKTQNNPTSGAGLEQESGQNLGFKEENGATALTSAKNGRNFSLEFETAFKGGNTADGAQVVATDSQQVTQHIEMVNGKLVSAKQIESAQMAETIQKISELAEQQLSSSGKKLGVRLEVKDLGTVGVDAVRVLDKIHLQVHVESNEIRRLLEGQLRPLVENMAKDGVDIGKLDVSIRDQRQENQPQSNFTDKENQHRHARNEERHSEFIEQNRPGALGNLAVSPAGEIMNSNGVLEIWA